MAGRIQRALWEVALDQHGFITSADARRLGIAVVELGKLAARDQLERVGYGIYRFGQLPVTPLDAYRLATLWPGGRGVLSHDTALDLHELCDINPSMIHITVPADGYRPRRQGGDLYVVHREALFDGDVTRHEGIPIVKAGAAIRQGVLSGVSSHLLRQALNTAGARGQILSDVRDELEAMLEARL